MLSTHRPTVSRPTVSRRALLAGAAGLVSSAALVACGAAKSSSNDASLATNVALTPGDGTANLIALFGTDAAYKYVVSGHPQRLAFGINDARGAHVLDVPTTLDFQLSKDGVPIGGAIPVVGHSDGVPIGYYPYRTTFDSPGQYEVQVTLDGVASTVRFDVGEPANSPLIQPGSAMVSVATPTLADHQGVEPICTQPSGTCAFHTITVARALTTGKATALLVSTPEFCQIGVCGPVLELLNDIAPSYPLIQTIHAEVYTNAQAALDQTNSTVSKSAMPEAPAQAVDSATLAPVIDAYGLSYEPALFIANGSGQIVERLDNIFDRAELTAAFKRIS
ncbi:MAG: hypothetical protein WCK41_07135 [Actinomycetes bacterium]